MAGTRTSTVPEPTPEPAADQITGRRTGAQSAWNYLVFALSKSSVLIMTVVLARLLEPADFGLFALALLIINLFDYVKDLGVGAALVQSPSKWNRLAPTGMTLTVAFGVAAAALLASTAHWTAGALGHPELEAMIQVLAVGLAISSLSAIPAARLRRNVDFRARLWPEFAGAVVKTSLTIGLAVGGLGVWSLVYGQLAAVVVTTALYWRVARVPVRFGFDRSEARRLISFGLPVTSVTLLAYAIYNVDYLAVGARLGDTALGLYTLAYRLPELGVLALCVVISEVLFSSLSRLQHDREALARHYRQALVVVVALTAPIGAALAVTAPAVVDVLYGAAYADAAGPLAALAVFAVVYSASFHSGDVYKAIGRPGILTAINAGKLLLMVGPLWWAAGHGVLAVGLVLLAVEVVHFVVRMAVVRLVTGLSFWGLVGTVARPLLAAAAMAGVVYAAGQAVEGLPSFLQLLLLAPVGLVAYLVALRVTAPAVFRSGQAMLLARVRRSAPGSPVEPAPVPASEGAR